MLTSQPRALGRAYKDVDIVFSCIVQFDKSFLSRSKKDTYFLPKIAKGGSSTPLFFRGEILYGIHRPREQLRVRRWTPTG